MTFRPRFRVRLLLLGRCDSRLRRRLEDEGGGGRERAGLEVVMNRGVMVVGDLEVRKFGRQRL